MCINLPHPTDWQCVRTGVIYWKYIITGSDLTCAASELLSDRQLHHIAFFGGSWVHEHTGPVTSTVTQFEICNVVRSRIIFRINDKNASSIALYILSNLPFIISFHYFVVYRPINCKMTCFCDADVKRELKADVGAEDPGDLRLAGACTETKQSNVCEWKGAMVTLPCKMQKKSWHNKTGLKTKPNHSACSTALHRTKPSCHREMLTLFLMKASWDSWAKTKALVSSCYSWKCPFSWTFRSSSLLPRISKWGRS